MEPNEEMREHLFDAIRNQLKSNNPPETKETFNRLLNEGYDEFQVMQFIGQCLAVELYEVIKSQKPFVVERYVKNLKALPEEPF